MFVCLDVILEVETYLVSVLIEQGLWYPVNEYTGLWKCCLDCIGQHETWQLAGGSLPQLLLRLFVTNGVFRIINIL